MIVSFLLITLSLFGILYVIRLIRHRFGQEEGIIKIIHMIMFSILFNPLLAFIEISLKENTIESIGIIVTYLFLYLGYKRLKMQK